MEHVTVVRHGDAFARHFVISKGSGEVGTGGGMGGLGIFERPGEATTNG